jgi:predicted short-subunit dehydrogenase-like oxidoreductase (DUF2520 family)
VQTSFLIIGGGRMARHFARYLELESLPYTLWSRSESEQALRERAEAASHVLLLISDGAISSFYESHPVLHERRCVHFSGSLVFERIRGAHPLMTFSNELYDLETYRRIPFVLERGGATLAELLPGLTNPSFELDANRKGLYHALCAMSGNFTILLWEKVFAEFEAKLGLPRSILVPYLEQVTENLSASPPGKSVLTGPLVRGDYAVVEKHLKELKHDPYEGVYRAFVAAFQGAQSSYPEVQR